ncbi:MAG TPA: hypothetical protein VF487_00475 [Chitinophagaceae bacterium]
MRQLMRAQILRYLLIFLFSCSSSTNDNEDKILSKQKIVKSLGSNSAYQISVWENYSIEERNGPDFTVYYLYPADTTKELFGNGGIYFGGHPQRIQPDGDKKLIKDSLIVGNFLGKKVDWIIFDYGSSISAETILEMGDYEKISAFAYGHGYSDIDSLISVLESLKRKE